MGSFEIYRKFEGSSLKVERQTVHVSDDSGRIAMLEKRTFGIDPSPASLVRYIYSNHLQSASLELDDNAAIISYEEYHPYGTTSYQAMNASINAVAKRYRYTGKERDEESGLYYHGARYYIPWLCRWTAVDPLESKYAGMSPYNYAFNNPVMFNDPSGMDGIYTGTGTKEDPYVIQANYYYSGLNEIEEEAFKAAIDEYNLVDKRNPNGKAHEIRIDKSTTIYVKFELTAINYDSIEQNADEPLSLEQLAGRDGIAIYDDKNVNTEYYRYGHQVEIGNNINDDPMKFAFATDSKIKFDRNHSKEYYDNHPSDRTSYLEFVKAIFIHEIGHTLTAVHGDPGGIMKYVKANEIENNAVALGNKGTGKYAYSMSTLNDNSIRAIVGRLGQSKGTFGGESKYLKEKEKNEKKFLFDEWNEEENKMEKVKQHTNSRIMKKP